MLENIHPAVAFGVIFVIVVGIKFFARKQGGKPVVDSSTPMADVFMRLLGVVSDSGLEGSMGDILRAFISDDKPKAAEKAQATLDVMATADGRNSMLKNVFEQQLEARLKDPALYPAIAAKVEQLKPSK